MLRLNFEKCDRTACSQGGLRKSIGHKLPGGGTMQDTVKLDRTLGLWSVVLFGLAYMTPMIVFGTFGALAAASQGTTAMAYLVAAGAILLTAISYGVMARVYPVAGSAYTYVRRSINSSIG